MGKYYENMVEIIGKTPLVKLNKIIGELHSTVLVKLENLNPGGSIKDRAAYSMIIDAESKDLIKPGFTIIEPTSGNTGVGLAWISVVKGYKVILVMPDTMTNERKKLFKAYGAEIVFTEGEKGMRGAIDKAEELVRNIPDSFMPHQFNNKANPEIHRKMTAQEILEDTNGKVDVFVAGIGTGGTITGVGEVLKKHNPGIKIVAVEPKDSAILSGEDAGPHMIQGIGAGFIPAILNTRIFDEIIKVGNADAFETSRRLAKEEAILCGISSGANVYAALQIAKREKAKTIVTIIADTGERYLSTSLFDER